MQYFVKQNYCQEIYLQKLKINFFTKEKKNAIIMFWHKILKKLIFTKDKIRNER